MVLLVIPDRPGINFASIQSCSLWILRKGPCQLNYIHISLDYFIKVQGTFYLYAWPSWLFQTGPGSTLFPYNHVAYEYSRQTRDYMYLLFNQWKPIWLHLLHACQIPIILLFTCIEWLDFTIKPTPGCHKTCNYRLVHKRRGQLFCQVIKNYNFIIISVIQVNIYYGFSLLHLFSLVLQPWMSAYIRKTYISVS